MDEAHTLETLVYYRLIDPAGKAQPFPILNKAMCVAREQSYPISDARNEISAIKANP